MKISPLEIRQKSFEKNFRGYDKEEVDAFLLSLSQEWERVMDESKELKMRLQSSDREVQKLREVESTLYKTLKTAEDTGANIVEQANKSAELLYKEAQMNAESMLNEARTRSKTMYEEADERAKNILFQAQSKLSEVIVEIKSLENQKQNLVHELKQLAGDLLQKANRIATPMPLPDFGKLLTREEAPLFTSYSPEPLKTPFSKPLEQEEEAPKEGLPLPDKKSATASFFDQID